MNIPAVPSPDLAARARAAARQDRLTKPRGSLGRLEEISLALAAATGQDRPATTRKAVLVMAADHGVAEEGVSLYPADVTRQMVLNFIRGGAAINVLARQAGARVVVVNAGLRTGLGELPARVDPSIRLVDSPVAYGTACMTRGPAMTRAQAEAALRLGLQTVKAEVETGLDLFAGGDMGIGNSTAAAAIVAALTGEPPRSVAGRGTGIDDASLERKVSVIERALAVNRPDPSDPLEVLRRVGGLEIAALAGAIIGSAAARVPVVLDGFICGAAALAAAALVPEVKPYLIASHLSVEPGHRIVLERLGLRPILDLGLRLGEGTGAVLAFHIVEGAARVLGEMATFEEAGVSER